MTREVERAALCHLPTPLERLDRLARHLGLKPGQLMVKRDDMTGLAGGGNKARKLEFLVGDALTRGSDVLVTGGGIQSNHARMTAAAARRYGLECVLVLAGRTPGFPSGNFLLDTLFDAEIVWTENGGQFAINDAISSVCTRLKNAGRRPYEIPVGGATAVGGLGYVEAQAEIVGQLPSVDQIFLAVGSGNSLVGLAVGFGEYARLRGVAVGAGPGTQGVDDRIACQAEAVSALLERSAPSGRPLIDRQQVGAGDGVPNDACREALHLAATLEGLVLDPVYTGVAMAGLIAAARAGDIQADERVLFLHTGGLPGLFALDHAKWLTTR